MKNILVPVEDHHSIASVLRTAQLAGERFGSRIEGIPLGPDFQIAMDYGIAVTINNHDFRRDMEDQARRIFETFAAELKPSSSSADPALEFAWNANGLVTDIQIGSYGRIFDLVVVGRPGTDVHDARHSTLEAALFDSGRPILIAPPVATDFLGNTIAVSWNASSETARTLSMAMPFLKTAQKIVIISVSGAMVTGPSAELLATTLERQGLPVDLKIVDDTSNNAGRTILSQATKIGADLLIKGGYTQSRLRQMIFGGATSQILAEATIPVFMAH